METLTAQITAHEQTIAAQAEEYDKLEKEEMANVEKLRTQLHPSAVGGPIFCPVICEVFSVERAPPSPAHTAPPLQAYANSRQANPAPRPPYRVGAQHEQGVRQLLPFHDANKSSWDHTVGYYCQESGRSPSELTGPPTSMWAPAPAKWKRDLRKPHIFEKDIIAAKSWSRSARGTIEESIIAQVAESDEKRQMLDHAIRQWANSHQDELWPGPKKAGFTKDLWTEVWKLCGA